MSWKDSIKKGTLFAKRQMSEEEKKRIESINAVNEALKMLPDHFEKALKRMSGKVDEKKYAMYEKKFEDILDGMRDYRKTLMQGKSILKENRIAKATLEVDPETKIRYKKWDGQGRPPINSLLEEGKGRGKDLTGWDYVVEQAGRRPGQGVVPYDSSGFQHDTMGHQPYIHKGPDGRNRYFCLKCQVEFRGR
tara:strand:- start:2249 stop:2824 length:576 start_codon:yes stop_codon:yes gene_type:complete